MEKEVNFLRVQNEQYEGMYWRKGQYFPVSEMFEPYRHPMPHNDSLIAEIIKVKFLDLYFDSFNYGFSDFKQLRSWIYNDEWIAALYDLGFAIYSYVVPDDLIVVGNTQTLVVKEWFDFNKENFTKKFKLEEIS